MLVMPLEIKALTM